jgi:hypothetical protein
MTYDFYADDSDKIQKLNFIFQEWDRRVFDLASPAQQMIREYKATAEIVFKLPICATAINLQ